MHRQRITVQFPLYSREPCGGVVVEWHFLCKLWAQRKNDDCLTIRFHPSVRPGQEILMDGDRFRVEDVEPIGKGLLKLSVSNSRSRAAKAREREGTEAQRRSPSPRTRPRAF